MNEKKNLLYAAQGKEISLADLIWKMVYSWRAVFLWGIIFACLLSGVKYAKDSKNRAVNNETAIEGLRMGLSDDEVLALEKAVVENESIERQLKFNTDYQKYSVLMNIDPYNENQVVLQYYIDTHYMVNLNESVPQDYASSLLESYLLYVKNDQIVKGYSHGMNGESSRYLSELIRTDTDFDELQSNTFCITVTGEDMKQANSLADAVRQDLEAYQKELAAKIGTHDLILVSEYEQVIQDNALAEKQAKVETANYNLRLQQDNLKGKLSLQQLQILEFEEDENAVGVTDNLGEDLPTKTGISKKYAVLGFLIGAFFVCVAVALRYVFHACLKNEKELQEFYGLRIFGSLHSSDAPKRLFSFVDRGLDRIRGKQKRDLQQQMDLTVANLLVTCKRAKLEKVFLTASVHLNEEEAKLLDRVMKQMKKESIEVVFGENMIRNKESFMQMSEIGQVVLVEKVEWTPYQDLEKELILCHEQEANVLGVIAIA